jgi:hypothetical protein
MAGEGRCLCASGYSTGVGEIEDRFNVSSEIGTLGLSLYLVSNGSLMVVEYAAEHV